MPEIPTTGRLSQTGGLGRALQRPPAGQAAATAAQGAQQLSRTAFSFAQQQVRRKRTRDLNRAEAAITDRLNAAFLQAEGSQDPDAFGQILSNAGRQLEELVGSIEDRDVQAAARSFFERRFSSVATRVQLRGLELSRQQGVVALGDVLKMNQQAINQTDLSEVGREERAAIAARSESKIALAEEDGTVTPKGAQAMLEADRNDRAIEFANSLILEVGKHGLDRVVDAIRDESDPVLRHLTQNQRRQLISMAETEAGSIVSRAEAEFEARQDAELDSLTARLIEGQEVPVTDISRSIIEPSDKRILFNLKQKMVEDTDALAEDDPALVNALMQRIFADDEDPDRITGPQQIVGLIGNGISLSTFNQMQADIKDLGQPMSEIDRELVNTTLDAIQEQIRLIPMADIKLPEDAKRVQQVMAIALDRLRRGRQEGISTTELTNQLSEHYIGKGLEAFAPSLQERARALERFTQGTLFDTQNVTAPQLSQEEIDKLSKMDQEILRKRREQELRRASLAESIRRDEVPDVRVPSDTSINDALRQLEENGL